MNSDRRLRKNLKIIGEVSCQCNICTLCITQKWLAHHFSENELWKTVMVSNVAKVWYFVRAYELALESFARYSPWNMYKHIFFTGVIKSSKATKCAILGSTQKFLATQNRGKMSRPEHSAITSVNAETPLNMFLQLKPTFWWVLIAKIPTHRKIWSNFHSY